MSSPINPAQDKAPFGEDVEASVLLGGALSSHKGVNLPGANLKIPGFTDKDRVDLEFGLSQGIDAVAISFVRTAEDVETVRQAIAGLPKDQQRSLALAYFKGLSHQEIADVTCEPLGTVKTRIRLAMQKLRQSLENSV